MASSSPNRSARHTQMHTGALFRRFLLVGIWNTAFGYTVFAALTALLTGSGKYAFIVAYVLSSLISITVSFLGYKWFVFRTHGNYFREWLRTLGVYSVTVLINLAILPLLVALIETFGYSSIAPYAAGAVLAIFTAVLTFCGHFNFSFRANSL